MWILKGTVYGGIAFVVFAVFFFISKFGINTTKAISVRTAQALTFHNPWFWTVCVLMIVTGVACARLLAETR